MDAHRMIPNQYNDDRVPLSSPYCVFANIGNAGFHGNIINMIKEKMRMLSGRSKYRRPVDVLMPPDTPCNQQGRSSK